VIIQEPFDKGQSRLLIVSLSGIPLFPSQMGLLHTTLAIIPQHATDSQRFRPLIRRSFLSEWPKCAGSAAFKDRAVLKKRRLNDCLAPIGEPQTPTLALAWA